MQFPTPLIPARLLRRYKRFLADMQLADGSEIVAHCPNPGSMLGLAVPGTSCWLSRHQGTRRKLANGWELAELGPALVGLNTGQANAIVAEALAAGRIAALQGYDEIRREVRVGAQSRLDFLLTGGKQPDCYVEVKSVTLSRIPGLAEFPDARTSRGTRHLEELAGLAAAGQRTMLLFLVQRDDCSHVRCAADIDPVYAATLKAVAGQIEIRAFACRFGRDGNRPVTIELNREIPVEII